MHYAKTLLENILPDSFWAFSIENKVIESIDCNKCLLLKREC